MTYNPNIPMPTDNLSVSQGQMLTNFTQLNTQFGVDHTPFRNGGVNGDGFHKQVSFSQARSSPVLAGTNSMVYPKTVSGVVELFFANAAKDVLLSPSATVTSGGVKGVKLPSGIIVNYASSLQVFSSGGTTNTFAVAYTAAPAVIAIPEGSGAAAVGLSVGSVTTTNFVGYSTSPSANVYFIAVGF
jgi:hypothetical protein